MRNAVGKAGWNKELAGKEQTLDDLKFDNYVKEMFLDSDTKIAQISSAPSEIPQDWFLTNQQMADARTKVNTSVRLQAACSPTPSSRPARPAGWTMSMPPWRSSPTR